MAGITPRGAYELLTSGAFSDFTIIFGEREFNVHRSIVCADSHFFRSVADGKFKAECGPALHTGYDSEIIGTALLVNPQNFSIRFAKVAKASTQDLPEPEHALSVHAKVYQAADKLNLEKLKILSSTKFLQILRGTAIDPIIFEKALFQVYNGTSPEDTGLRLKLTSLYVQNPATIFNHVKIVAAIEKHELLS